VQGISNSLSRWRSQWICAATCLPSVLGTTSRRLFQPMRKKWSSSQNITDNSVFLRAQRKSLQTLFGELFNFVNLSTKTILLLHGVMDLSKVSRSFLTNLSCKQHYTSFSNSCVSMHWITKTWASSILAVQCMYQVTILNIAATNGQPRKRNMYSISVALCAVQTWLKHHHPGMDPSVKPCSHSTRWQLKSDAISAMCSRWWCLRCVPMAMWTDLAGRP